MAVPPLISGFFSNFMSNLPPELDFSLYIIVPTDIKMEFDLKKKKEKVFIMDLLTSMTVQQFIESSDYTFERDFKF